MRILSLSYSKISRQVVVHTALLCAMLVALLSFADETRAEIPFVSCEDSVSKFEIDFNECQALSRFFTDQGGNLQKRNSSWKRQRLWLRAADICLWTGVVCRGANKKHVVRLELSANGLTGTLSNALLQLTKLEEIDFSYNQISGRIDTYPFGRMAGLLKLNLQNNRLEGRLPAILPPTLEVINLSGRGLYNVQAANKGNLFTGTIPASWQSMSALKEIYIHGNRLTGDINVLLNLPLESVSFYDNNFRQALPSNFSKWDKMRGTLDFSHKPDLLSGQQKNNRFTGQISQAFCDMPSVKKLDFAGNQFKQSSLPRCLLNMPELEELLLTDNNIGGELPAITNRNSKLQYLDLSHNNFRGEVPGSFADLSDLTTLYFSGNKGLNGNLPIRFQNLASMQTLAIVRTSLCRPDTETFKNWIESLESFMGNGKAPCKVE